ncbi:uncharacterized protein [Rhodnius prolixus]|uniref:uncharacterized protein n=1 Tax=Rhodnius prolixus TaxID=13249 RepID=UPI003D18F9D4
MEAPPRITKQILSLLYDRTIYVRCNGVLYGQGRQTHVGLPQGAILSPILFTLYTANLADTINSQVGISQFADDILIYSQAKSLNEATSILYAAMDKFNKWCTDLGLTVSESKSSVTIFTRRRRFTTNTTMALGPYNLQVLPSMRTLGVWLDSKLTWKDHINYVTKKCEQCLNILRMINHLPYGADSKTSLTVYKHLVLSRIDYGSFLYGDAAPTHLNRVDKIQYKALRSALGALISTPINALLVEAREFPLNIRRKILASRFITNRLCVNSKPVIRKISNFACTVFTHKYWLRKKDPILVGVFTELSGHSLSLQRREVLPFYTAELKQSLDVNKNIHTNFYNYDKSKPNSVNNAYFLEKLQNKFPSAYVLYTDGSKSADGVGCSVYDVQQDASYQYQLGELASIFTAELVGINQSLQIAQATNNVESVGILSDSKSALFNLKHPGRDAPSFILETVKLLHNLSLTKPTHLIWIKAHSGLKGN